MKIPSQHTPGLLMIGTLALLTGAVGCIDFDWELSNICERNQQNPACGGTPEPPPEQPATRPPEIIASAHSLDLPEQGIFRFSVEARDPQNSRLHFVWKASNGYFESAQTDTAGSSETRWVAPPCTQKAELPIITATVENERGLAVPTQFKLTYAMYCNSWSEGGKMALARSGHTLSPLRSGQVLVAGGMGSQGYVRSTELLDPENFSTSATGMLRTPRAMHTAAVLGSGQVLVVGGFNEAGLLSSAELYDPATAQWLPAAEMSHPRAFHTATVLSPSQVLVTGASACKGVSRA